jgi:hypothetical protein
MGLNNNKEVTMTLHLSQSSNRSNRDSQAELSISQPLARGCDCDIFALRLRERPPEPPERLLEFFERTPQRPLSHTALTVIDVLLTGDLSRIR